MAGKTTKYSRYISDEYLRERIKIIGHELIACGEKVIYDNLHQRGLRGSRQRVDGIRDELIAAGVLPPECKPERREPYRARMYAGGVTGPKTVAAPKPPPAPLGITAKAVADYRRATRAK